MKRSRKRANDRRRLRHTSKRKPRRFPASNGRSSRKKASKSTQTALRRRRSRKKKLYPVAVNDKLRGQMRNSSDDRNKLQRAYESGYKEGIYQGGEAIVEQWIPAERILPELTVSDLIQAGVLQCQSSMLEIADARKVAEEIKKAMDETRAFSLVRLGDGELLTLAYNTIKSPIEAHELGAFLPYAGVPLPDASVQAALIQSVKKADYVGVPKSRRPEFQMLLFSVSRYYGWNLTDTKLTNSLINYEIHHSGMLLPLLAGRRVLLIGNKALETAGVLRKQWVNVTGCISPVLGFEDIERVLAECRKHQFDVVLVAAGVAAVVLCQRIASEYEAVALDIGHLADEMIKKDLSISSI